MVQADAVRAGQLADDAPDARIEHAPAHRLVFGGEADALNVHLGVVAVLVALVCVENAVEPNRHALAGSERW